MPEVRIAAAAERDLGQIFVSGAERFGVDGASAYRDGLNRVFALLADYPLAARARPDLGNGIRSKPYRSHVVFYEVGAAHVTMVRVLHGAMDAMARLGVEFDE